MPHLYIFGDSITWGAWDLPIGGWAQRLKTEIDNYQLSRTDYWCAVYNLGIPGDTAEGVLGRLANEMNARLDPNESAVILLAIGINDSIVNSDCASISVEDYYKRMKSIFAIMRNYSSKIGCIGLFPIDETKLRPTPWDANRSYTFDRAKEFNAACLRAAKEENVPLLDVWGDLVDKDYRAFSYEGLHPNTAGHEHLYKLVREFLKEKNLLPAPFV